MSTCLDPALLTASLNLRPAKPHVLNIKLGPRLLKPASMQAETPSQTISPQSFAKPLSASATSAISETSRALEGGEERPGKRARLNPPRMTAAAAMAEGTSLNPQSQVMGVLKGHTNAAQSKPPAVTTPQAATKAATTMSEPLTVVAENLQLADPAVESPAQTSPVSVSSLVTIESVAAPSTMAATLNSPSSTEDATQKSPQQPASGSTSPEDPSKAYSFPAPHFLAQTQADRRHQSLPNAGSPRSPAKKHKCPYCATEFTRHHNLKSHLLTHSHEKPYVCSTCQSRFRRLHDLKRHTKLHTGERPHICPKCGRKFARGDALARHNKGPGGCAGRRASMGSLDGDGDEYGNDDSMDGVVYNEPESLEEEEGNERRPGIKRHAPSGDEPGEGEASARFPSTYPPIQGRPPGGIASGNFPPRGNFAPASNASSAATGSGSLPHPYASGSTLNLHPLPPAPSHVFSHNPMTESPKPLSPNQPHSRPPGQIDMQHTRSPSLASQYGRGSGGPTASGTPIQAHPGPQLPPPHSLGPVDPRYTIPSQSGPTHPPTQPSGPPTHMAGSGPLSSQSNSLSSHGPGSGENVTGGSAPFGSRDDRIWAYMKSLEQRMNSMQDEIVSLRAQLAASQAQVQSQLQS